MKKGETKASIADVAAFLALLFLGPFLLGSLLNPDYSFPAWGYLIVGWAVFHIYQSTRAESGVQRRPPHQPNFEPGEVIETNVVGVTFEGRQREVEKLSTGQRLHLLREPDNPHDTNAIAVLANKYSERQQEVLRPELEDRYGKWTPELIAHLYEKVQIGYINRHLAAKITPIFDRFAIGPNQFVTANVTALTGRQSDDLSKGVRISFRLPTEDDLRAAIEMEIMTGYPL